LDKEGDGAIPIDDVFSTGDNRPPARPELPMCVEWGAGTNGDYVVRLQAEVERAEVLASDQQRME